MSQAEYKKRLKALMAKPENQVCSDCPERQPRWASLIVPPPGSPAGSLAMGAFTCLECSGSHRRLGVHIAFVRSITLDSWKEKEVLAMENGGNKKINAIFEASQSAISNKPSLGASGPVRERFIRDKYERRKYYDSRAFGSFAAEESSSESESEEEEASPPRRTVVRAPSEAAKLRAQARKLTNSVSASGGGATPAKPRSSNIRTPVRKPIVKKATAPPTPTVDLLDFSSPPTSSQGLGPPPNPPSASPSPTLDMFKSFQNASITNPTPPVIDQNIGVGKGNLINNIGGTGSSNGPAIRTSSTNPTQADSSLMPQVETKKMTSDDILAMFHAPSPQSQMQPNAFGNFGPSGMSNVMDGGKGTTGYHANLNNPNLMTMNGLAPNMMAMNNMNGIMQSSGSGMHSQGMTQMHQRGMNGNLSNLDKNFGMQMSQQPQMHQQMQPNVSFTMDSSMQSPMGGTSSNLNVMGGASSNLNVMGGASSNLNVMGGASSNLNVMGGGSEMSGGFTNFHQQDGAQNIAIASPGVGTARKTDTNPQIDQFASFASFR